MKDIRLNMIKWSVRGVIGNAQTQSTKSTQNQCGNTLVVEVISLNYNKYKNKMLYKIIIYPYAANNKYVWTVFLNLSKVKMMYLSMAQGRDLLIHLCLFFFLPIGQSQTTYTKYTVYKLWQD